MTKESSCQIAKGEYLTLEIGYPGDEDEFGLFQAQQSFDLAQVMEAFAAQPPGLECAPSFAVDESVRHLPFVRHLVAGGYLTHVACTRVSLGRGEPRRPMKVEFSAESFLLQSLGLKN